MSSTKPLKAYVIATNFLRSIRGDMYTKQAQEAMSILPKIMIFVARLPLSETEFSVRPKNKTTDVIHMQTSFVLTKIVSFDDRNFLISARLSTTICLVFSHSFDSDKVKDNKKLSCGFGDVQMLKI